MREKVAKDDFIENDWIQPPQDPRQDFPWIFPTVASHSFIQLAAATAKATRGNQVDTKEHRSMPDECAVRPR